MLIDTQTKLADTQALTATAISNNVLDLRNAATPSLVDEGILSRAWLNVLALTAANGADAAKTLTITLESSAAVGLTTPTVHFSTAAIVGSAIAAGTVLVRVPLPSGDYLRYLGLRFTVSAGFTAFNVHGFITLGVQRNVIYPIGFAVA